MTTWDKAFLHEEYREEKKETKLEKIAVEFCEKHLGCDDIHGVQRPLAKLLQEVQEERDKHALRIVEKVREASKYERDGPPYPSAHEALAEDLSSERACGAEDACDEIERRLKESK